MCFNLSLSQHFSFPGEGGSIRYEVQDMKMKYKGALEKNEARRRNGENGGKKKKHADLSCFVLNISQFR